ncbi:MAG: hypothetical protein NTAFB01_11620 [Nitrospira sp.]
MALYAFDGTWNVDEADEIKETNVLAFCKCLPLDMRVFYLEGVGWDLLENSSVGWPERVGVFGLPERWNN